MLEYDNKFIRIYLDHMYAEICQISVKFDSSGKLFFQESCSKYCEIQTYQFGHLKLVTGLELQVENILDIVCFL